jgi:hypothetical protein
VLRPSDDQWEHLSVVTVSQPHAGPVLELIRRHATGTPAPGPASSA